MISEEEKQSPFGLGIENKQLLAPNRITIDQHPCPVGGEPTFQISRRSGRPLSYGLVQSDRRPDLYAKVLEFNREENAKGAMVRPQTTARGIGMIYNLFNRTPWDRMESWRALRSGSSALGSRAPKCAQNAAASRAETWTTG